MKNEQAMGDVLNLEPKEYIPRKSISIQQT